MSRRKFFWPLWLRQAALFVLLAGILAIPVFGGLWVEPVFGGGDRERVDAD